MPNSVSKRHALAGLGQGFWVSKFAFEDTNGLDDAITVNEDTDFCIALLSQGAQVFRASQPGVCVFTGVHDTSNQSSVTRATRAKQRAQNFQKIAVKHAVFLRGEKSISNWLTSRWLKFQARADPFHFPKAQFAQLQLPLTTQLSQKTKFYGLSVVAMMTRTKS